MVTVYGQDCMSDKPMKKWSAHFRASRESLVDDPRPSKVITTNLIDKLDYLMRRDRHVTLQMLAAKWMSALEQCEQLLRYWKVYMYWVS